MPSRRFPPRWPILSVARRTSGSIQSRTRPGTRSHSTRASTPATTRSSGKPSPTPSTVTGSATLLGSARPNPTTFLIPGVAGDFVDPDSVGMYDYDLAKAEAILAAAGLFRGADGTLRGPDGDPVELNIPLGGKASAGGADEKILAILREDLGKLGITIKTVAYESEKEYRKAMARAPVFIDGMPAMLHDDADDLVNFAYTPLGQENYYQYHDPDYDALAIEVRNTTDRESRKEIGYMMQKILAKDVPTIPVCSVDTIAAYRSDRFTGWEEETEATGLQDIRTLTRIRPAAA